MSLQPCSSCGFRKAGKQKQEAEVPKCKIQINKQAGDMKLARKRQRGEAKETREQCESRGRTVKPRGTNQENREHARTRGTHTGTQETQD